MKGNSLFIASLAENASIFEASMSLALKSAWQKSFSSAEKKSLFYWLSFDSFNVILSLIFTIYLLGVVAQFKFLIFSSLHVKTFLVSDLTLVSVKISVDFRVDKQLVRVRKVVVDCLFQLNSIKADKVVASCPGLVPK